MLFFQIQLITDSNPERVPYPSLIPVHGLSAGLPREESGTDRELEEHFEREIVEFLEDNARQIAVVCITTPSIVEHINQYIYVFIEMTL